MNAEKEAGENGFFLCKGLQPQEKRSERKPQKRPPAEESLRSPTCIQIQQPLCGAFYDDLAPNPPKKGLAGSRGIARARVQRQARGGERKKQQTAPVLGRVCCFVNRSAAFKALSVAF
ncbi:MAG: hypothetical protein EOM59_07530, partial [Clostridia bacterium]|nr:hypothetical protein [Clostridia bacterium]